MQELQQCKAKDQQGSEAIIFSLQEPTHENYLSLCPMGALLCRVPLELYLQDSKEEKDSKKEDYAQQL